MFVLSNVCASTVSISNASISHFSMYLLFNTLFPCRNTHESVSKRHTFWDCGSSRIFPDHRSSNVTRCCRDLSCLYILSLIMCVPFFWKKKKAYEILSPAESKHSKSYSASYMPSYSMCCRKYIHKIITEKGDLCEKWNPFANIHLQTLLRGIGWPERQPHKNQDWHI